MQRSLRALWESPGGAFVRLLVSRVAVFCRAQRAGLLVSVAALCIYLVGFTTTAKHQPDSDGFYNWLYARSIAYDHDIHFRNDYAVCGGANWPTDQRVPGRPDNPFYVGPSLFWVPAILVVKPFVRIAPDAAEAIKVGCRGPVPAAVLTLSPIVGALVVWLSYRAARRVAGDGAAAFAAALFAFGSPLGAYAFVWFSFSHVYDAFCTAGVLVASLRAYEKPERMRRWIFAGVVLAACVLQRLPNAFIGLLPLALAIARLRHERRALLASIAGLALTAMLLGLLPQLLIYKYLYGRYFAIPQGHYYLQWAHAHPWLLLFAPKGLFFMAPVTWLSVVGASLALRPHPLRIVLLASVAVVLVLTFIASAPLDWHGWNGLGARRLIALTPLFVLLAVLPVVVVGRWLAARPARAHAALGAAVCAPLAFVFVGAGIGVHEGKVDSESGQTQAGMYGAASSASWSWIDKNVGSLAVLPFELPFRWRYGLSHEGFVSALNVGWFERHYQTLEVKRNRLDFNEGTRSITTGFGAEQNGGLPIKHRRATVVFTPYWPFASRIVLKGSALRTTRVRVGSGRLFGGPLWFGEVTLGPKESAVTVPIPRGGYDSGVNELVLEAESPDDKPTLKSFELFDDAYYPPNW